MKYSFKKVESVDFPIVSNLILGYYQEDKTDKPITAEKIQRTLTELSKHPDKGVVLLLEVEKEIVGYCILVNFWSNEYGGNILIIDEIYLVPNFRGQGIATDFIRSLATSKYNAAVGLMLGVSPSNLRARKLYATLGFRPNYYPFMWLDVE